MLLDVLLESRSSRLLRPASVAMIKKLHGFSRGEDAENTEEAITRRVMTEEVEPPPIWSGFLSTTPQGRDAGGWANLRTSLPVTST